MLSCNEQKPQSPMLIILNKGGELEGAGKSGAEDFVCKTKLKSETTRTLKRTPKPISMDYFVTHVFIDNKTNQDAISRLDGDM